MEYAVNTKGKGYLPDGHFDKSVDPYRRPSRWSEGEGHFAIEIAATPEGVAGMAAEVKASKAKKPLATILKYLTILHDDIRKVFPAGTVPPVEEVTLRSDEEMQPVRSVELVFRSALAKPFEKAATRVFKPNE